MNATDSPSDLDKPAPASAQPTSELPLFCQSFPAHPGLRSLCAAFERGQYHLVRAGARELAESSTDPAVVRSARELLQRTEPDRLAVRILVGSIALLIFLSAWAFSHGHP